MSNVYLMGPWVRRFLEEYIVTERNLSRHTQKSYRDTFQLLLPFVARKLKKSVDRLAVNDLTSKRVLQFVAHLEEERACSVQTRNQRLSAIRAFARFVGSREPVHIEWCGQICALVSKKETPQRISPLTKAEMDALLDVPNRNTWRGRNEYALLLFLFHSGARVSEATQLKVGDLQVGGRGTDHALVTLHGKGGKIRQCPVLPDSERALAELTCGRSAEEAVFISRYRRPYTRFGVYRVVERCAAQVPDLSGRKITPHVLRHTMACQQVRAGVDINTIRALLRHSTIDTTNVYAEIDLEMKAKAIALCDAAEPSPTRPWKEDKGVMAFLKSL